MITRYTDRALTEIDLGILWYEEQKRGLGSEFLDCVEAAVKNISKNPKMYQKRYSNFRSCPIRRFPFSIFYTIEDFEIILHSVFDSRQDPQKGP
ncbi:type II toxin-antitoxin system RelE/ParE family toxin [uncultured Desulfobacter sp.]|uniref:type II toxin-antitoxin system RelE/ParE family toxin n=1 Tax=uncultured Desulfobacter sp. TaxID=240139 RepID=UPI002AAB8499|nr:type II toxin-antitoxin system RelE/ParE family toxin [uncultured Desulfobacter sp.]